MYTDPDDLLLQHQHLLMVNVEDLGESPLANKQVWISRMEAAILAKEEVNMIGPERSEQTEPEEGGRMDGESRVVEEH